MLTALKQATRRLWRSPGYSLTAILSTGPLLKPIRETLARLVPDRPLSATPAKVRVDQQLAGVRTNAYQVLGFALVGLALALIGVYGVLHSRSEGGLRRSGFGALSGPVRGKSGGWSSATPQFWPELGSGLVSRWRHWPKNG